MSWEEFFSRHRASSARKVTLIAVLGIAVAVLLAISPCFGAYPVSAEEVFGIL